MVRRKDVNKEIYFLDNTNFSDWVTKKRHFHDFLKELNDSNTQVYINDKKTNNYKKYFIPKKEGTYNIKIVLNIAMKDISFMFSDCRNIISIDLSSLDTSCVTDISHMFYQCSLLNKIDFSSFYTGKVVDMSYMFLKCINLEYLDISSFKVNNVKNFNDMFFDCTKLKTVTINHDSSDKIVKKLKSNVNIIII